LQNTILSFNDRCAEIAADIYKNLKEKHQLIGTDDILIAATTIRNEYKLESLNTKDFSRIPDVQLLLR